MRTNYYIQQGQVITNTNDNPPNGLFSLTTFFKKMLSRFHVAFNDDCCDATADPTNAPVRFNATAGHLQYYNYSNNTWTNVPSL
jgi:hypothetical protein